MQTSNVLPLVFPAESVNSLVHACLTALAFSHFTTYKRLSNTVWEFEQNPQQKVQVTMHSRTNYQVDVWRQLDNGTGYFDFYRTAQHAYDVVTHIVEYLVSFVIEETVNKVRAEWDLEDQAEQAKTSYMEDFLTGDVVSLEDCSEEHF